MGQDVEETRCIVGNSRREKSKSGGRILHHVATCSVAWENWRKLGGNIGHVAPSCRMD